jgi:atypical dual specificity phosphatase
MRPENFGWLIDGQLAGSGRPIHSEELKWLREQSIGAIVDETAPSQAQMDEFVGFVGEMLERGKAVLVHCQGGYGRTGPMLACYLVSQG